MLFYLFIIFFKSITQTSPNTVTYTELNVYKSLQGKEHVNKGI